ncbi:hypothetical protein ANN_18884 [Periplaneta americana]|uniref:Reverse transcriptase domain-containing protein n=1 Tax=Periplaneta americana TaxID=6978 RepID=A0ABQ8SQH1_PERAM|nr:hypothetical protein ANN_18884 [Periplaneta americana]
MADEVKENNSIKVKSRKRVENCDEWEKNVRKRKINNGQEYAMQMEILCLEKCTLTNNANTFLNGSLGFRILSSINERVDSSSTRTVNGLGTFKGLHFVIGTHCCERVQSAASASATEIKDSRMQLRTVTRYKTPPILPLRAGNPLGSNFITAFKCHNKPRMNRIDNSIDDNSESFKYVSQTFINRLLHFLYKILAGDDIPTNWTKSIVVRMFKRGDIKSYDNYRGISLLNTGYKIFTSIIKNKLYKHYEFSEKNKLGFRKERSCCDGYFTLILLMVKHREFNLETHIAFIDLKKAFDRVNRNKLLNVLATDHVPQQLRANIYNINKTNLIAVSDIVKNMAEQVSGEVCVENDCVIEGLLKVPFNRRTYNEKVEIVKMERPTPELNLSMDVKKNSNDLIFAISGVMIKNIKSEIEEAPFVAIVVDETSDCSNQSQLSTVLRYVDSTAIVQERFIGFTNVSSGKTAAAFFSMWKVL